MRSEPGFHFDAAVFHRLLQHYDALSPADLAQRWLLLEAAHVVGQTRLRPHWRTHGLMLDLAWRSRDGKEIVGQLLRLLLVPVGHALGRLPLGNPGRSNVSALRPMTVREDITAVIERARAGSQ
jgi:hypothetical protein